MPPFICFNEKASFQRHWRAGSAEDRLLSCTSPLLVIARVSTKCCLTQPCSLGDNPLGDAGAKCIADACATMPSLQSLSYVVPFELMCRLRNSRIKSFGAEMIAQSLHGNSHLRKLKFVFCPALRLSRLSNFQVCPRTWWKMLVLRRLPLS